MEPKIPFPQSRIYYGGDYNPEQWPEATWQEDMRLMKQAGVNLVTLGVFSWANLEPRPGTYTFEWMDRIIALLHENGIGLCLATATASPPPWLAKFHPESLPVDAVGVSYYPGGRQAYCPHSEAYGKSAAALVRKIAERFGHHPALKIWHINNEYGCHISECFCDVSTQRFRQWLEKRYQTIEALNDAWATSFWSQRYGYWDEINPPRRAPTYANPTQQLDWLRFSSDSLLELMEMEKAILRELTPDIPVTTNFLGFWKSTDQWNWSKREDVISVDSYPDPAESLSGSAASAMLGDLVRSLGNGRPWLLMEQAPSAVNWRNQNAPKSPGQMRLWSLQSVVRGAGAIMFFQWRASRAGAEKHHSGMVQHGGVLRSRVWDEVVSLGNELKRLDTLLPSQIMAEVAIILDWENWWALELDSKPSMALKFHEQLFRHYEPLFRLNIPTDFVHPGDDLAPYKLVIIPNLYLVRAEHAENIVRYVEKGGTVLMSFFSGIVNEDEHIWLGGYPAPFRRMLGLCVEEFAPAVNGQTNTVRFANDTQTVSDLWAEVIHLEGAQAQALFAENYFAGKPALTRHRFGRGTAWYLGTRFKVEDMVAVFRDAFQDAGVSPTLTVPAGIEVIRRIGKDRSFLCVLNHLPELVKVDLQQYSGTDLLTGQHLKAQVSIEPFGVQILAL